jgi:phosphoadenosine phosphosulfate reductase
MWCKNCNIETTEDVCPICGNPTEENIPTEVYWCNNCRIPIIRSMNDKSDLVCPTCGRPIQKMATDVRPVFPEERLLLELLLGVGPNSLAKESVWASKARYYINGEPHQLPQKIYASSDTDKLAGDLKKYEGGNSYEYFNEYIERFVRANADRLNYLIDEAGAFIRHTAEGFKRENVIISFSGGKDSTVTADLVTNALSDPSIVHIFGNTTLEFPKTLEYAERFRKNHPKAIFQVAQNTEQVFLDVADDIGPPARMMRWCCSMFKTGPITRILNGMYPNQQVLTFYGIRKVESVARSKYNRVEDDSKHKKINKQTVATPIFYWNDVDIWLYILSEKIDFNDAYRLGYERVGCWLCPNNNARDIFLSKIYMQEKSKEWRDFLVAFATKIGKPDPEEYVDSGAWKARQGGNGLAAANDVKIRYTNCTSEDHAKIYRLVRSFSDELVGMFVPFGKLAPELGRKLLHETIVLDARTNVPIMSIQPFQEDGYEFAVKVRTMNVQDHDALQRKAAYQIRKYNACRKCLKCESVCKAGAISIVGDYYYINPEKCVHCLQCVDQRILRGGCLMDKYLRTKE